MATPNLAHHNQLQLLSQQQRQQNPAYAKERVQAIVQACPPLPPCAYTSVHTFNSSVHTTSALRVLPPIIIKSFRVSIVLSPPFRVSKPSSMVCLSNRLIRYS